MYTESPVTKWIEGEVSREGTLHDPQRILLICYLSHSAYNAGDISTIITLMKNGKERWEIRDGSEREKSLWSATASITVYGVKLRKLRLVSLQACPFPSLLRKQPLRKRKKAADIMRNDQKHEASHSNFYYILHSLPYFLCLKQKEPILSYASFNL